MRNLENPAFRFGQNIQKYSDLVSLANNMKTKIWRLHIAGGHILK